MTTVLRDEITTGRNERLCGQIGVMQNASTSGLMIGPPAETLYAVEPLDVETITPSPKYRTPASPSAAISSSIMWNGEPAVTTASFSAVAANRRRRLTVSRSHGSHGMTAGTT